MENKFIPSFWKMSHGSEDFSFEDLIYYISKNIVMISKNTKSKGGSAVTQAEKFVKAPIGDYFYLTHGNKGIYLLGQFTGPANFFGDSEGWIERPYTLIRASKKSGNYQGEQKWWTPNHNSTFTEVPENELELFEYLILEPYFGLKLKPNLG